MRKFLIGLSIIVFAFVSLFGVGILRTAVHSIVQNLTGNAIHLRSMTSLIYTSSPSEDSLATISQALTSLGLGQVGYAANPPIWFESEQTGRLDLADFEKEGNCNWTGYSPDSLQRSGACNLSKQANDRMVLTHNWPGCDAWDCYSGMGRESNIPLLKVGETVYLMDYGYLHTGLVLEVIHVTDRKISPQTDFPCPTAICGTIVTSFGHRAWPIGNGPWGPTGYVVVRIAYR